MENNNENKIFSTRDINLAAVLISLHFEMQNIDYQIEGKKEQPIGYFNFENTPEIQEAIKNFWNKELSVEPRNFISNLRGLKAQINNFYENPHNV